MPIFKKVLIQRFFTREEILIILFILFFTLLGIGIKSYKNFTSQTQLVNKFENRSLDSILAAVFTEEKIENFDLEKRSTEKKALRKGSVNINKADVEELSLLPGIGEKTAERIIEYRNRYGSFRKIEEIMNVPRIGSKTFEKIKEYITIK